MGHVCACGVRIIRTEREVEEQVEGKGYALNRNLAVRRDVGEMVVKRAETSGERTKVVGLVGRKAFSRRLFKSH